MFCNGFINAEYKIRIYTKTHFKALVKIKSPCHYLESNDDSSADQPVV